MGIEIKGPSKVRLRCGGELVLRDSKDGSAYPVVIDGDNACVWKSSRPSSRS
jgi:hypothetical protein